MEKEPLSFIEIVKMFDSRFDSKIDIECNDYYNLKWWVGKILYIVTAFVTVVNGITKYFTIWIISMLGFKFKTVESKWNFVFLLSFTAFASIFVLLLLGAKLDFMPIIGKHFKNG